MLLYLVYSNIFIHTVRLQDCVLNFNKHGMQVTLPNMVVLLVTMIFCVGEIPPYSTSELCTYLH